MTPPGPMRGVVFAKAMALAIALGGLYVGWKYFKHEVLLRNWAWPHIWLVYAGAVVAFLIWAAITRFGTRSAR